MKNESCSVKKFKKLQYSASRRKFLKWMKGFSVPRRVVDMSVVMVHFMVMVDQLSVPTFKERFKN